MVRDMKFKFESVSSVKTEFPTNVGTGYCNITGIKCLFTQCLYAVVKNKKIFIFELFLHLIEFTAEFKAL